ncbi:MAG: geranylgeranylglycerol-phosphate geranylgeranyltransferase [Bacteroidetes bacterium]|nr:geranylgeranylglycerol-phosphate geranylgeranyltransferase [Bacteroidota bacterium]
MAVPAQNMISFLKLTRPVNLLLIILVQGIIKYGLLETLDVQVSLDNFRFRLLVFATVCIAAAGNVINDIFDVNIDRINKPQQVIVGRRITEKSAYNFYIILNILGVGVGFYLSNLLDHPGLAAVFIVISALLYVYATQMKSMLLLGNILISLLVASSLLILILFDIFPAIDTELKESQVLSSQAILMYAGFAFFINFIREIVKDLQDIDGDKNGGRKTLPIVLGRRRTVNVVFVLGVIALLCVLLYTYFVLYNYQKVVLYFVFLVAAPILFFCIKAWNAENDKHFAVLSIILKVVMFTGICSIIFYAEVIIKL